MHIKPACTAGPSTSPQPAMYVTMQREHVSPINEDPRDDSLFVCADDVFINDEKIMALLGFTGTMTIVPCRKGCKKIRVLFPQSTWHKSSSTYEEINGVVCMTY
jgi:hypothetical protein